VAIRSRQTDGQSTGLTVLPHHPEFRGTGRPVHPLACLWQPIVCRHSNSVLLWNSLSGRHLSRSV